ncbi:MAG: cobalamin biosynthesis protein CobW [Proteobacteria bacterium]|nr:cobalamin biosynthesis protein CobW [Pseudomonadota bacterium]MBU6424951.1 cobalamin biosynthesis protein CobW [Rhodospirillales bacterium]
MTDLAKIPVTIVTGFLGAGKTTLIKHLLANPGGKRLAVLVNEFGTMGVDGEILRGCADENCPEEAILELANGCICCTVADEFIPTMERLLALEKKPDHILIETSGLALPKPLLKAFDWPAIRSRVTVDGVVAMADAETVSTGQFAPEQGRNGNEHDTPLSEVFGDQMACADLILLSKADLAGEEKLAMAREVVAKALPRPVPMLPVTDGVIEARIVLGLEAAAEDDVEARPSHHDDEEAHEHDDFATIVVDLPEQESATPLLAALETLGREQKILRVKGHVAVTGKPMRLLVQAVGARVRSQFDKPWGAAPRATRLVVIAERHDLNAKKIRAALGG